MKKFLLFLMSAFVAMAAYAATDFNVGSLKYNIVLSGDYAGEVQCLGFTSTALAQNPTSVTIPGRVAYGGSEFRVCRIAANAFQNCTSLQYVYVDWGIVEISNYTFDGCSALYSVRLPSTITTIGQYAFRNCSSMGVFGCAAEDPPQTASNSFSGMKKCNVHVATYTAQLSYTDNSTWTGIDSNATIARTPNLAHDFADSNRFYIISTGREVSNYSGKATLVGVASSVTYIPITNVTDEVPKTYGNCSQGYTANITRIAPYACQNNTTIRSIGRDDLGATTNFESVGFNAFEYCTNLSFVSIPRGVIGSYAFVGCSALTSVQLYSKWDMDNGVYSIGNYAFYSCTSLSELMLTNTNRNLLLASNAFGNNASDFRCYFPIKNFYTNLKTVQEWTSNASTAEQKVHPFIVPETEWTLLSCCVPLSLPSSAQFYYVNALNETSTGTIATKQLLSSSAGAYVGMMMKATPGTIYRFQRLSSGYSPTTNYLWGIPNDKAIVYSDNDYSYYKFNPSSKTFEKIIQATTFYSGDAVLKRDTSTDMYIYPDGLITPYGLSICGVRVTSENCNDLSGIDGVSGTVNYNPNTKTLTLNNATITGQGITSNIDGIIFKILGSNQTNQLYISEQSSAVNEYATITGGGSLTISHGMWCGCHLTIDGNTKLSVTGTIYDQYDEVEYAIDGIWHKTSTGSGWSMYPYITLSGSGTELRLSGKQGLLKANSLTLGNGLHINKPRNTSFKKLYDSSTNLTLGFLVDASSKELRNTEAIINGETRGFKINSLWYDLSTDFGGCLAVIPPQQGNDYSGEITIPPTATYNGTTYNVRIIESNAFSDSKVTRVDVPASVERIESGAFTNATKLKTLVIEYPYSPNYVSFANDIAGNNADYFNCFVNNRYLTLYQQKFSNIPVRPWVLFDDKEYQPFSCAISVRIPANNSTSDFAVPECYLVTAFNAGTRTAKTSLINKKTTYTYAPPRLGMLLKGQPNTRYLFEAGSANTFSGTNYLQPYVTTDDSPLNISDDNARFYFNSNSNEWTTQVNLFTGCSYLQVPKAMLNGDYSSPVHLDLEYSETIMGDIDGNGEVDVNDLNILINVMLGKTGTSSLPGNPDINNDGSFDTADLNILINVMLGRE